MKLVARNFAVLTFLAVGLFSCKDDEGSPKANKLTIGEDSYGVTSGVFLKDVEPGTDNDGNEYFRNELLLGADGLTVSIDDGSVMFEGEGTIVDFMINNEGQELQAGTYTFQSEENEQPFDLWWGSIYVNWTGDTSTEYEVESGSMVITKSGDKYKATFEGVAHQEDDFGNEVADTDVTVSFQYEGAFPAGDRD